MSGLIFLGIALECCAAALGTLSKQLIALSENSVRPATKRFIWFLGIILNILVGPLVDASAYAFAPQTVIAPFASLDVLLNFLTAPCTLSFQREHLTWMHWVAALMVTGGAASAGVFGSNTGSSELTVDTLNEQLSKWQSWFYFGAEFVVVLLSLTQLRKIQNEGDENARNSGFHGLILGGVAGILMGNVFFVKGFVVLIRLAIEDNNWDAFGTITPYIMIAGAVVGSLLGTFFMQRGLRQHKGVYMVTIFEGAHISAACLSGSIVMGEMVHSTWLTWAAYWCSVGCIISGIALINYASSALEGSEFATVRYLSSLAVSDDLRSFRSSAAASNVGFGLTNSWRPSARDTERLTS